MSELVAAGKGVIAALMAADVPALADFSLSAVPCSEDGDSHRRGRCWVITNPSANQNRPPRHDPFRYFACASSAWLALRARVVAHTDRAVPVLPEAILDKESPAGEWVLILVQAVLSAPITPAMPFAHTT